MEFIVDNILLKPDDPENKIQQILGNILNIKTPAPFRIIKKSLDARKKSNILYRYRIVVDVPEDMVQALLKIGHISIYKREPFPKAPTIKNHTRIAVIGAGPAGLFCALRLVEAGAAVDIFERGKPVEERMVDITKLEQNCILNEDSNVLFGEGGAGTYSDGKLTSRTIKPASQWFFDKLICFGAPENILYETKPHLGTDRLIGIIKNIRRHIIDTGSKFYFNEKVDELLVQDNCISGIITATGKKFHYDTVVLAPGHSARDTYEMLFRRGIAMEKKAFAVGVRVEHPLEHINAIQYGTSQYRKILPSADYMLTFNNKKTERGTYSFCMCPGGRIINSSSELNRLCLNGMSYSKRDFPFSNAAVVVTIQKNDTVDGPLAGIAFQRSIEEASFKAGGGYFHAPAQRITSFMKNLPDSSLPESSFMPGVRASSINGALPRWITDELRAAFIDFEKRMKGFISECGLVIAPETRTSSPVRITRGENMQSLSHSGLYPAGEGAGYSGGIVSSAVDGIHVADAICAQINRL